MINLIEKIEKINVKLGNRSYQIYIGENLIANVSKYIQPFLNQSRIIVVTDSNVSKIWLPVLEKSFKSDGIVVQKIILPAGESTKTFDHLRSLIHKIFEYGVDRKTIIIALGGGVIGDLTGFAASIILRGLKFIQIPTTLLAQVDSSVGGKTAINTEFGKNLLGSFYQPYMVLADTCTLKTLPKRELIAGYAEVVKYAIIQDIDFFSWCEENASDIINQNPIAQKIAILKSCDIKAKIVAHDELELGNRAILNLGHTFGHAFEAEIGYNSMLLHGEAVAIGIIAAFKLSTSIGLCELQETIRIENHFKKVGLPINLADLQNTDWTARKIIARMMKDKKMLDGKMIFILGRKIGDTFISNDVSLDKLRTFLNNFLNH